MLVNTMVAVKYSRFGQKVRSLMTNERGDVNVVAIVVLIGVAVVLAIIFKDAVKGIITSLLDAIKGNAEDAIAR